MMNMPSVEEDILLSFAESPDLKMGVHLVLTDGNPVLPSNEVPSITTNTGGFWGYEEFLLQLHKIQKDEVLAEWEAQIMRFIRIAGKTPSHLDAHHHAAYFTEDFFNMFLGLADRYDCAIRLAITQVPSGSLNGFPPEIQEAVQDYSERVLVDTKFRAPDGFFANFFDQTATEENLLNIFRSIPDGDYELMCHPGYADRQLISSSTYAEQRQSELALLTNPKILNAVDKFGIRLISFADL
jgi:predicted glycoside hydrolase/deacetylase ChbG (UPF0249 family)